MVRQAIDTFGRLDTVVCNAGFLRDRMLANMSVDEWDAITAPYLRGHFVPARPRRLRTRVISRRRAKRSTGRIVNTSSGAGLMGSIGQGNYVAAKAGIAGVDGEQAAGDGPATACSPTPSPPMPARGTTEGVFDDMAEPAAGEFDIKDPANVSPLVVWLGSPQCDVTGRVFEIVGGRVNVCDGWRTATWSISAAVTTRPKSGRQCTSRSRRPGRRPRSTAPSRFAERDKCMDFDDSPEEMDYRGSCAKVFLDAHATRQDGAPASAIRYPRKGTVGWCGVRARAPM